MNAGGAAGTHVRRWLRDPMIIGLKTGASRDVAGAMMTSEPSGFRAWRDWTGTHH
jgi:hypothetical protein